MNIKELFERILSAEYTHLEETASFAFERDGDTL